MQGGRWRIIAAGRDITKLEQPLSVDESIYPAQANAREEIREAEKRAAKGKKRVLVVFGADWCYDCHVLDKAFHRKDIAAALTPNYEVVHVDVGRGEKNQDLMNEYGVPMKRGIPAIAILDSGGKLLYSQRNGEWERARALGPEDLIALLRKWKRQG
jgi:thiol:disulfide interchange protein